MQTEICVICSWQRRIFSYFKQRTVYVLFTQTLISYTRLYRIDFTMLCNIISNFNAGSRYPNLLSCFVALDYSQFSFISIFIEMLHVATTYGGLLCLSHFVILFFRREITKFSIFVFSLLPEQMQKAKYRHFVFCLLEEIRERMKGRNDDNLSPSAFATKYC